MELNKDKQNIYTVDVESYSEYMHENWKKPTNYLNSLIKLLLVILLLVLAYFFYKIVKADLSFSEVFNKQELLSTYRIFDNDREIYIEKEGYVEVLAKQMSTDVEKTKEVVLSVSRQYDELILEESQKEEVISVVAVEIIPSKASVKENTSSETTLSKSYLERMTEALNSI